MHAYDSPPEKLVTLFREWRPEEPRGALGFIRGTKTTRGLAVRAVFEPGEYPTGQKITDAEMAALNLEHHAVCPTWNYTIRPRTPFSR